jgi:hypothetical protein
VFTGNNDKGNKFIPTVVDTGGKLIAGDVDGDKHSVVIITVNKETVWCKNHENPSDQKSHTWAPLTGF